MRARHGARLIFFHFFQGGLHGFPAGLRRGASVRRGDGLPRTPVGGIRGVGREGPHEDRAHGLLQDQQLSAERARGHGKSGDYVSWKRCTHAHAFIFLAADT